MSAAPVSLADAVEAPLPARSVAVADRVQLAVPFAAAVVAAWPDGVPSVIVTFEPLFTIVEAVPVAPNRAISPPEQAAHVVVSARGRR